MAPCDRPKRTVSTVSYRDAGSDSDDSSDSDDDNRGMSKEVTAGAAAAEAGAADAADEGDTDPTDPLLPQTPIASYHPTPTRLSSPLNVATPDVATLITMLSEIREVVQGNAAAISDLHAKLNIHDNIHVNPPSPSGPAPSHAHHQSVSPDRASVTNNHAHVGLFEKPKRTAPVSTVVASAKLLPLSNRFDALRIEEVVQEDQDESTPPTSRTTISEQMGEYARKQKAKYARGKVSPRKVLPTNPTPTEHTSSQHTSGHSSSEHTSEHTSSKHTSEHTSEHTSSKHTSGHTSSDQPTRKVLCVSDSMCRSIRTKFVNAKLQQYSIKGTVNEQIIMDLNPGADA